jgi:hypothetical protein
MLDYNLHFARMVADDHLKAADERRRARELQPQQGRVFALGSKRSATRERGRS